MMRLKNVLIVVKDIEKSKAFYKELFGLDVVTDFGENVILTEGLVLQEQKCWEVCIGKEAVFGGNDAELYFEETDMDGFLVKLENAAYSAECLNPCTTDETARRVVRIYDPDGHVIEVGEPMRRDA